ncbi:hypothetical protein MGMO_164c00080 [Methyloglobulus morosus KoM1]|uniref:Uncharacterized protein n=1 Tax=Methyloglobulus morosus KoM1 TaxID=1116472 RepID=V5BSC3_9GAMM|nr:hypothetical protein [Methyloglobulus morosus]ESS67473.1 hypothetical protein MGMO_164c00080 [Methyloglobulus morosus KoM1]
MRYVWLPIHPKNRYTTIMKENSLSQTNRHLKNPVKAQQLVTRSIASSTAIETGEPIAVIEQKINRLRSAVSRVALA